MNLRPYHCTFWISHQFDRQTGKPLTRVVLNFGLTGFRTNSLGVFNFQGHSPSHHRILDQLAPHNWCRFLCRFGRDETCPMKITQPWFANALVYIRRQHVKVNKLRFLLCIIHLRKHNSSHS